MRRRRGDQEIANLPNVPGPDFAPESGMHEWHFPPRKHAARPLRRLSEKSSHLTLADPTDEAPHAREIRLPGNDVRQAPGVSIPGWSRRIG